eukprot:GEMP01013161.1.p1 GENE.GEMP01013161.1~~GEMP01013161.1.p1  ORF type:complete len:290 (+),score=54.90 GEMP01013161.1:556-1425(+)
MESLPQIPLPRLPGLVHKYSYSIDVLGRVIEVIEKKPLDQIIRERITAPLGMEDTCFSLPPEKIKRLVNLPNIVLNAHDGSVTHDIWDSPHDSRWADGRASKILSAGGGVELIDGGLVSTADDYVKFCEALRLNTLSLPDDLLRLALWENNLPMATNDKLKTAKKGAGWNLVGMLHLERIPHGMVTWGGMAGTKFGLAKDFSWVFMTNNFCRHPKDLDPVQRALRKTDFVVTHAIQGQRGLELPPVPPIPQKGKGKGKGKGNGKSNGKGDTEVKSNGATCMEAERGLQK